MFEGSVGKELTRSMTRSCSGGWRSATTDCRMTGRCRSPTACTNAMDSVVSVHGV